MERELNRSNAIRAHGLTSDIARVRRYFSAWMGSNSICYLLLYCWFLEKVDILKILDK
jgi:hypothetical protein